MTDGKYSLLYRQFLYYEEGADGKLKIVKEEATIILRIYRMYLKGRTPSNTEVVLTNEKYHAAALLQKTFTEDFLTKKWRKNNGELPQYFIEDDHEPIISKSVFDEVQQRLIYQNNA